MSQIKKTLQNPRETHKEGGNNSPPLYAGEKDSCVRCIPNLHLCEAPLRKSLHGSMSLISKNIPTNQPTNHPTTQSSKLCLGLALAWHWICIGLALAWPWLCCGCAFALPKTNAKQRQSTEKAKAKPRQSNSPTYSPTYSLLTVYLPFPNHSPK